MNKLNYSNLNSLIILFFFMLLFSSCSSVKESSYKNDFPLTSQKAFSRDSSYYVLIPKGWFYSVDNGKSSSDIFLVKNNFAASLNIIPINIDSKFDFETQKSALINYSRIMKEAAQKSKLILIGKPEYFNINNIECAAFQYYNNLSLPVRTILYEFNNHIYELNAYITEEELNGKLIPDNIYAAQNTILYSLKKANIN